MSFATLLGSTGSPYVRKVRVLLLERAIPFEWVEAAHPVQRRTADVVEWSWQIKERAKLERFNPLGKIPVLLHDGQAWFDSRVICDYVDTVICRRSAVGIDLLTAHALADAVCDLVSSHNAWRRRAGTDKPANANGVQATSAHVRELLSWLESADITADVSSTLATPVIALCVALAYLDFRLPGLDWRASFPKLAAVSAAAAQRSSLAATRFPGERP